ncbi:HlyD family secretion protein [Parapedobacter luteus]|uniref:HlyD family secretion protein n=1 Tax=Parapedobacter luteus TaxID=623280 RepID=A0A1T4ZXL1_9SPHI|nr:HlyD family efflux transporter periplasmic adaptor subunit [Parapedobacter luteus]SKB27468.1 HlyD family secretion protein [Parapedobacter luteus]
MQQKTHSEDIRDIISTPPSWLLRWGITSVLLVLFIVVLTSTFIHYPDVVRASVRINALNAPRTIVSKVSGNVVKLLVWENKLVTTGQELALMESTANHSQVLGLLRQMQLLREKHVMNANEDLAALEAPVYLQLGELQSAYQAFYQSYLSYRAAAVSGIYPKRRSYIQQDISNIKAQREQLLLQQTLQEQEYTLAEKEFGRYKALAEKQVISPAEFQQQQAALLAKQYPIQQTKSTLLTNESAYVSKTKELAEVDNQIAEEKSKFIHALNSLISDAEHWKSQYVLTARQSGKVAFVGIIQENQYINAGQEVFYINPGSTDFFGEVNIPQYNMGEDKRRA